MKILLAKNCGFCSGVKRSAMLTESDCYEKPIYTWGPLIHNEEFIKYLKSKKIYPISNFTKAKNATIITRSHGIKKQTMEKLASISKMLVNGTCPNVQRIQKLAEKLEKSGKNIIIFGDPRHPEIIGIRSYLSKSYIISDIKQIKSLPKLDNIALISQTTSSVSQYKLCQKLLTKKYKHIEVFNTICNATELRQRSAHNLSKKVDLMIVIGGKHSSNTQKLFNICKLNTKTHLIQTQKDLKTSWFKDISSVGITAGASTPDWIIKDVISYIKSY